MQIKMFVFVVEDIVLILFINISIFEVLVE